MIKNAHKNTLVCKTIIAISAMAVVIYMIGQKLETSSYNVPENIERTLSEGDFQALYKMAAPESAASFKCNGDWYTVSRFRLRRITRKEQMGEMRFGELDVKAPSPRGKIFLYSHNDLPWYWRANGLKFTVCSE